MKELHLANVEEAKEFERLPVGGYVCGITAVEDVTSKEYLKLEYDIADGKFKNYYRDLYQNKGFWGGSFVRSYKEKALPFFKGFITCMEKSNPGYHFDNDETKLKRKLIGLVLGEEEYQSNDGNIKTRLYVAGIVPIDKIKNNDFKVPPLKKLAGAVHSDTKPETAETTEDDDLPF